MGRLNAIGRLAHFLSEPEHHLTRLGRNEQGDRFARSPRIVRATHHQSLAA